MSYSGGMKSSLITTLVLLLVLGIAIPTTFALTGTQQATDRKTATLPELMQKYSSANSGKKVRILIMPGHEPGFGGAEYQNTYEREITVEIADELANYLKNNPRFEVIVARSNTSWTQDLANYFQTNGSSIQSFVTDHKNAFAKLLGEGQITQRAESDQVVHAAALDDVAMRLYGINKWANENNIDLVLHIHLNDSPDHGPDTPSQASGFAVYIPDAQYGNAATSRPFGEAVAARLSTLVATSTLPIENKGVVEDQQLIALGAYNTLSVPSALVEYSYITEPQLVHPEIRQLVAKDYAYETYLGIQDFFKDSVFSKYPSASLPFTFATDSLGTGSSSPAAYTLQAALHTLNFYPAFASTTPANVRLMAPTLTTCPINGMLGACTTNAIEAFQIAKGIPVTGTLSTTTVNALNTLFSNVPVPIQTLTTGACPLSTKAITLGAKDKGTNDAVARLQTVLSSDAVFYPGRQVTGTFGPATLTAVKSFQIAHGLAKKGGPGYGIVGPKTRAALETVYCS
ncbi:MAG: hypothetical protein JWL75_114 [Parcubacteria group bacterium]|nr:hypothetical protein [Parcubacteria group bacterium]